MINFKVSSILLLFFFSLFITSCSYLNYYNVKSVKIYVNSVTSNLDASKNSTYNLHKYPNSSVSSMLYEENIVATLKQISWEEKSDSSIYIEYFYGSKNNLSKYNKVDNNILSGQNEYTFIIKIYTNNTPIFEAKAHTLLLNKNFANQSSLNAFYPCMIRGIISNLIASNNNSLNKVYSCKTV